METIKFYGLLATAVLVVAGASDALGIGDKAIGCSFAAAGVVYGFCRRD